LVKIESQKPEIYTLNVNR